MITINKSTVAALAHRNKDLNSSQPRGSSLGTTSRDVTKKRHSEGKPSETLDGFSSLSFVGNSAPLTGMPNTNVSGNAITIDTDPMMTGLTPMMEWSPLFQRIYRDMYFNDAVCGSAADMLSSLPFSEFSLGGIEQRKVEAEYMETIERLNARTICPEIALDYLVQGEHCSSLLFNKDEKKFTDLMPQMTEDHTITPLPFRSQDPIIEVKFNDQLRAALSKDSKRIARLRKQYGSQVFEQIQAGQLELEPLSTLWIARRTFSHWGRGTSWFRRVLPTYLIEKNLFRGTLIESARRQRGIMHLTLGDGDWEPTIADMEFITELFMNADSDPLGATIATRSGVSSEEIRAGGEFWKHTDFADQAMAHKLRALGISESILSGEASYNTADAGLTIFVDTMRTFRDMLTRRFFYDKLFPMISLIKGYTLSASGRLVVRENLINEITAEEAMSRLNDGSRLLIPQVHWAKQLKPEGDSTHMEMLGTLSDKGIPIPIRLMAAAGGLNLDDLLKQQEEDLKIREKLQAWQKALAKFAPADGEGASESAASALLDANLARATSADPTLQTSSAVLAAAGRTRPVNILDRNWGDGLVHGATKTGKRKHIIDQKKANERMNKFISKAASRNR